MDSLANILIYPLQPADQQESPVLGCLCSLRGLWTSCSMQKPKRGNTSLSFAPYGGGCTILKEEGRGGVGGVLKILVPTILSHHHIGQNTFSLFTWHLFTQNTPEEARIDHDIFILHTLTPSCLIGAVNSVKRSPPPYLFAVISPF